MQGAKLLNIFIINKFLSVFYSPTMICLICLRLRRGNNEFNELTNFIGTGNGRFGLLLWHPQKIDKSYDLLFRRLRQKNIHYFLCSMQRKEIRCKHPPAGDKQKK